MNENIEQMAKEYKQALASDENGSKTAIEQMILLEENQLDMLGNLNSLRSPLAIRTIGYLKNLIFRSLKELNEALGNESYIPSLHNANYNLTCSRAVLSLYDMQISIFVLLDKLTTPNQMLNTYENRKMSMIVTLLR